MLYSPHARAVFAYGRQLLSERRYGDLIAGLGRVLARASLVRARSGGAGARHPRAGGFPDIAIDARNQKLSAQGQIENKFTIDYPSSNAPLLVSVIIPCFNYGRFVNEAVLSVLGQTIQSLEVIVVDDGSSDPDTHKALDALEVPVRVVKQATNQGLPITRNTGIAMARGEYICCLDADDTLEPMYLELAIATLEADRSAGFAYSWVQLFGDETRVWHTRDFDIREAVHDNHTPVSAVFRRDDWLAAGGYRLEMHEGYEDWEFWLRIAALGRRGRLIRAPLFNHRRHGQTMTHKAHAKRHILIQTMRNLNPSIFNDSWLRRRIHKVVPAHTDKTPLNVLQRSEVLAPPDTRPHLLVVIPWLADGGAEVLLTDVLAHLKPDWRISIVTTLTDEQPFWPHFREITDEIVPLVGSFTDYLWLDVIKYLLETRRTRVLLSSGSAFAYEVLGKLKQIHPGLATVDILHNDLPSGHMRYALGATQSIDRHVVVNHHIAASLAAHKVPANRIVTIRNGIDTKTLFDPREHDRVTVRERIGLPEESLVVAWVGRLSEEKRPLDFLSIVAELAAQANVRVLMVGDGPLSGAVTTAIKRLELDQITTRFMNLDRARMPEIYAAADVLVITSSFEGTPFVALEALAMGCPVAATNVGEVETLIADGETGWLVPVDRPQTLVAPLLELAREPAKLRDIRIKCRRSVKNSSYNLSSMCQSYRRLFQELCAH